MINKSTAQINYTSFLSEMIWGCGCKFDNYEYIIMGKAKIIEFMKNELNYLPSIFTQ